jgi:SAM-dependent methyltransferase
VGALQARLLGAILQFLIPENPHMPAAPFLRLAALALFLCTGALAQAPQTSTYEPSVGQEGKDVVWVPTSQALLNKMLDMARVTPKDFVMDLGSGDGRTVIAAAKRGARALGIEYDADMVELSRVYAEKAGVSGRAQFRQADLFETDFSEATVITMFLLPAINLKLRPRLLDLKPGTRIVSNTFTLEKWRPDETATLDPDSGCESWCTALLWIVPARVAGSYSLPQGELALKQEFQMLSGTLRTGGKTFALEGRVRGEELELRAGGRKYRGRVTGKTLDLR